MAVCPWRGVSWGLFLWGGVYWGLSTGMDVLGSISIGRDVLRSISMAKGVYRGLLLGGVHGGLSLLRRERIAVYGFLSSLSSGYSLSLSLGGGV